MLNFTTIEVRAWMNDYIPLFYMDVITYPCLKILMQIYLISVSSKKEAAENRFGWNWNENALFDSIIYSTMLWINLSVYG